LSLYLTGLAFDFLGLQNLQNCQNLLMIQHKTDNQTEMQGRKAAAIIR
jgi:hypothetical protein